MVMLFFSLVWGAGAIFLSVFLVALLASDLTAAVIFCVILFLLWKLAGKDWGMADYLVSEPGQLPKKGRKAKVVRPTYDQLRAQVREVEASEQEAKPQEKPTVTALDEPNFGMDPFAMP